MRHISAVICLLSLSLLAASPPLVAADAQEATEDQTVPLAAQPIYLPLKPAFIVNYGGDGRLKYIKADLTARLSSAEAASAVRHHLPYIRNNIVRLLGSQTDETIESQAGKEALRKELLKEVQAVVEQEEGISGVEDVFFDSLIVQR